MRIPGLKKKSPYGNHNLITKLIGILCNLGVSVSNYNCPLVFLQWCCQGSVCLSIIDKITVKATNFVNHTS